MMLEDFEEALQKKFFTGTHVFTGKRTHIVYTIQRNGTNRTAWSLFARTPGGAEGCIHAGTTFANIAHTIWCAER